MLASSEAFASFSVDDLDRARRFYGDTLGLEVRVEAEGLGLDLEGGTTVFIYPKEDHAPATFTVLNFRVHDIEPTVDALAAAGVEFEHYSGELQTDERGIFRGAGPVIAWFTDPAGNILSVVQV